MQGFSGELCFGRSHLPQVAISAIVHYRSSSSISKLLLREHYITLLCLFAFFWLKTSLENPVGIRYNLAEMMYFAP